MSEPDVQVTSFEDVNDRLKQIVEAVSDDELPLDEALDLFDEAVALGMKASEMMEDDIATRDAADEEREAQQAAADEAADAELNAPAPVTEPEEGAGAEAGAEFAADPETGSAQEAGEEAAEAPQVELDAESDLGADES